MSSIAANTTPNPTASALRQVHHWINGQLHLGEGTRCSDVYNPATGKVQANVMLASAAEVDQAVNSACRGLSRVVGPARAAACACFVPLPRDLRTPP